MIAVTDIKFVIHFNIFAHLVSARYWNYKHEGCMLW